MTLVGALTSSQDGATGGSSVTFGFPAGTLEGHHCFYVVTANVSSTAPPSAPAGHVDLADFSVGNNNTGFAAYRRITAADITAGGLTVSVGGNRAQGAGAVLKDLDATTPYEAVPAASAYSASPNLAPSTATTVANSEALELATSRSSAPSASDIGFAAGWTRLAQYSTAATSGANETAAVARRVMTSAGSVGGDSVSFTGTNLAVVTIALRAAVAGDQTLSPTGRAPVRIIGTPAASASGSASAVPSGRAATRVAGTPSVAASGSASALVVGRGPARATGTPSVVASGAAAVVVTGRVSLRIVGFPALAGSGQSTSAATGRPVAGAAGAPSLIPAGAGPVAVAGVPASSSAGVAGLAGTGDAGVAVSGRGSRLWAGTPSLFAPGSQASSYALWDGTTETSVRVTAWSQSGTVEFGPADPPAFSPVPLPGPVDRQVVTQVAVWDGITEAPVHPAVWSESGTVEFGATDPAPVGLATPAPVDRQSVLSVAVWDGTTEDPVSVLAWSEDGKVKT